MLLPLSVLSRLLGLSCSCGPCCRIRTPWRGSSSVVRVRVRVCLRRCRGTGYVVRNSVVEHAACFEDDTTFLAIPSTTGIVLRQLMHCLDAIQWCGLGKVAHINALCHSNFEGNLLVQCLACKQVGVNGSQSLH